MYKKSFLRALSPSLLSSELEESDELASVASSDLMSSSSSISNPGISSSSSASGASMPTSLTNPILIENKPRSLASSSRVRLDGPSSIIFAALDTIWGLGLNEFFLGQSLTECPACSHSKHLLAARSS